MIIIFRFKLSPKSMLDFKRSDIAIEMTWGETASDNVKFNGQAGKWMYLLRWIATRWNLRT